MGCTLDNLVIGIFNLRWTLTRKDLRLDAEQDGVVVLENEGNVGMGQDVKDVKLPR